MKRINGGTKYMMTAVFVLFATFVMMLPVVSSKQFIVGGSMGWTSEVNYALWEENQTFYRGDSLYFVYDTTMYDVIEVTQADYETCNAQHPVFNYTSGTGRDLVMLDTNLDRYFITSKSSCNGGMKLHVHLNASPRPTPKSCSSRFTVLGSQLVISAAVTIAAIWDSLNLCLM